MSLLDRGAELHRSEDARCIQETCGRRLAETAERSRRVRSCRRLGIILREIQTSLGESGYLIWESPSVWRCQLKKKKTTHSKCES